MVILGRDLRPLQRFQPPVGYLIHKMYVIWLVFTVSALALIWLLWLITFTFTVLTWSPLTKLLLGATSCPFPALDHRMLWAPESGPECTPITPPAVSVVFLSQGLRNTPFGASPTSGCLYWWPSQIVTSHSQCWKMSGLSGVFVCENLTWTLSVLASDSSLHTLTFRSIALLL